MEGDIHTEAQGPPSPTAQKVLDAAVDLLRATGQLSMRKLAQSANVATGGFLCDFWRPSGIEEREASMRLFAEEVAPAFAHDVRAAAE